MLAQDIIAHSDCGVATCSMKPSHQQQSIEVASPAPSPVAVSPPTSTTSAAPGPSAPGANFWMDEDLNRNPKYLVTKVLGKGSFGAAYLAQSRVSPKKEWVAVKQIKKCLAGDGGRSEMLEVDILKRLSRAALLGEEEAEAAAGGLEGAPCGLPRRVTVLREVKRTGQSLSEPGAHLFLVMDLCRGGNLREAMDAAPALFAQEDMLKALTRHLLQTVDWMHKQGVAHLDLKPENLLFSAAVDWTPCADTTARDLALQKVVVADFGLASFDPVTSRYCGTNGYASPHLLRAGWARQAHSRDYPAGPPIEETTSMISVDCKKSDLFSVGVIVAELACQGDHPFHHQGSSKGAVAQQVDRVDCLLYSLLLDQQTGNQWYPVPDRLRKASPGLRDFVSKLLVSDPIERLSAEQALQHPWLN